jgi:broad specificity phosphatase PhoE
LSTVYFFRHGQAGLRDDYDRLSELGHEQARLLGEYVCQEQMRFDRIIIGGLRRQRETAEAVLRAMEPAGLLPADIRQDANWNEFDLDAVFDGIAPRMALEDPVFDAEFKEIQRLVQSGDGHIHRSWTPADTKVVTAWVEGRYEFEGESWKQFVERVKSAGAGFADLPKEAKVAVFTSATPISIWIASCFASEQPWHILGLAGAAVNSNYSVLHWRQETPTLGGFNAVPHLREARLRTFR